MAASAPRVETSRSRLRSPCQGCEYERWSLLEARLAYVQAAGEWRTLAERRVAEAPPPPAPMSSQVIHHDSQRRCVSCRRDERRAAYTVKTAEDALASLAEAMTAGSGAQGMRTIAGRGWPLAHQLHRRSSNLNRRSGYWETTC